MPGSWSFRVSGQAGQHRAIAFGIANVAAPVIRDRPGEELEFASVTQRGNVMIRGEVRTMNGAGKGQHPDGG